MSSVQSQIRQTNILYTNARPMQSSILTADGTSNVAWSFGATAATNSYYSLSTAGTAVFRDMGELVYLPSPTTAGAQVSTVLRKVQLVPQGALQTGQGVGSLDATTYFTGYVRVGGVDGTTGGLARIN